MQRSNKPTPFLILTALVVLALTASTYALFTNGGFEAGDFSGGWVKSTFSNPGLSGAQPYTGASIVRNAGGSDRTTVVGPAVTPLSLTDPLAPAVQYPRFGQYAGRVNYTDGVTSPGRNANSLLQQAVVGPGDVDGFDGLVHMRFAYLPVLEDGNHDPAQQAYFYIGIRNVTKGTLLWERFTFANEPGVPWQSSGLYRYTNWQLVDASGGAGVIDVGDTIQLEVIAAGCSQSGHRGHVYVDAFGSSIPGGTVAAVAPATVNAGAAMTYALHVVNGGSAPLESPVVSLTVPPQTTFASVNDSDCSHAAGVVTCNFADLAPGATRDFQVTVNTSPTASGTITLGTYSIAGTSYPALLGPIRATSVVNTQPTAGADAYSVAEDGSLSVAASGVLGNDSDPEGNPLSATLITNVAHGSLSLSANGSFTYTPTANYFGADSFVYRATDGVNQSANATVSLTVTPLPDPPAPVADSYSVAEDGTLTRNAAQGVRGNDVDPDGDTLTIALVSGVAHGSLALSADGSFTYTPDANYHGPDGFTYSASDGATTVGPIAVTLTVTNVNDAPAAAADTYAMREDVTLTVPAATGVLANDGDLDTGDTLTAVLVSGPSHGNLTLNADGSFTYVPDPEFHGVDTFTYRANDGTTTSAPVTVTLNIADDASLRPGAGRAIGGTRVTIDGSGFGPAGTPVSVSIGGMPAIEAEVVDDTHITFVTPALPANTPVDVILAVNNGAPETLTGAYLPMASPVAGSPTDTDGDGITDELELKYGLDPTNLHDAGDDADQDGISSGNEIANGTHPTATWLRYFAEGVNNTAFNTGLAVANASPATMEVQISFFRQGATPVRHNLTLAGHTRTVLNTAAIAGMANAAFGIEVAANEAVAADRTTFWDVGGREAHSEHAVEASPTWYFAEGATTGRFSLFYLLTNPGSHPANATVTFLRQVGAPITRQVVIPAYARYTIPVNTLDAGLASAEVGGIITADRPIVAERSMYLSTPTRAWAAGTGGTGVTAPSAQWFFGEGATGDFFDAWILLSNPGSTDATVTVRYVADSGADVTRTHAVPAGRRITIRVVDEDPAMRNTSFSTFVTSTNSVPVVAERAMWWRAQEGQWTAGHVGVGFTAGGRKWVTADGVAAADGSSDTYALVTNTENRSGQLKVTAVFDDGSAPVERLFAIGPNQRFTLRGRQRFPEVVGKGYSFIIESIGATPVDIVVDHSTYFDVDGRFWAIGTTSPGSKIR